jgi:hypothetical protein
VDGHDRKELVDGPVVGKRLEDREIAEVAVHQLGVDVGGDLRVGAPVLPQEVLDGGERAEVVLLGVGLVAQGEDPAGEVLLGPLLGEDGVVERLPHPVERE